MSRLENHSVSAEIKRFVSEIIAKNNFKETCEVKYSPGSQVGDGFATKTYAVEISDGETSLSLFLKCAIDFRDIMPSSYIIYLNEIYFYKTVYPAYTDFCKKKGVEDGFRNVPMSYGFDEKRGSETVALENLRQKGFTLFDRFTNMNDEHLKLTLTTFAKFHAISFAIKDQRKEMHNEFCEHSLNFYTLADTFPKMFSNTARAFLEKLNPIQDKDILDKCHNLSDRIVEQMKHLDDYITDYAIFAKGDCWVNNMMILYENDDREHPKDVMLVDWQCTTRASPVHDIEALFYAVASRETVDNYKYYMDIYYEELCKRIKELGSDPHILYPRSVFDKEWIDYGVYAVGIVILSIKVMLLETGNAPTVDKNLELDEVENIFSADIDNQEQYMTRVKYIMRHMISIGIL